MSAWVRSTELILKRGVAGYRTLTDHRDAVHQRVLAKTLSAPVDRDTPVGNTIDHVHKNYVMDTDLTKGKRYLVRKKKKKFYDRYEHTSTIPSINYREMGISADYINIYISYLGPRIISQNLQKMEEKFRLHWGKVSSVHFEKNQRFLLTWIVGPGICRFTASTLLLDSNSNPFARQYESLSQFL